MESFWSRLSNLISLYVAVLAACSAYNYITAICLFSPAGHQAVFTYVRATHQVVHQYVKVRRFDRQILTQNEAAQLALAFDADMSNGFNWNINQMFLFIQGEYSMPNYTRNEVIPWDHIVTNGSKALLSLTNKRDKYRFADFGNSGKLLDAPILFKLQYQYMPKVGLFHTINVATFGPVKLRNTIHKPTKDYQTPLTDRSI